MPEFFWSSALRLQLINTFAVSSACNINGVNFYICRLQYVAYICRFQYDAYICRLQYVAYICRLQYDAYICRLQYDAYICRLQYDAYVCRLQYDLLILFSLFKQEMYKIRHFFLSFVV